MEAVRKVYTKAKDFLISRAQAYQKVFNSKNVYTEMVLMDLAKFCRAHESTFHVDPRVHSILEGRREVWLRICHHTKLDPEQLWKFYGKESQ